jgi:hypothetical protein
MTGEFTAKQVRHIFFERETQACFNCRRPLAWTLRGSMLAGGWSLHHLQGRGMGGTRRVMTHADGIALCGTGTTGCHGWVEANRDEAYDRGLLIRRNGLRPAEVRVKDMYGQWWLLTEGGRAVEVDGGQTR